MSALSQQLLSHQMSLLRRAVERRREDVLDFEIETPESTIQTFHASDISLSEIADIFEEES